MRVCLHVCLYTMHVPGALQRTEKGIGFLRTKVTDSREPPCGCLESNPGSLQKHPVPLTEEPFLQPPLVSLARLGREQGSALSLSYTSICILIMREIGKIFFPAVFWYTLQKVCLPVAVGGWSSRAGSLSYHISSSGPASCVASQDGPGGCGSLKSA